MYVRIKLITWYSTLQREGFSKFNKIYEFDFTILGKVSAELHPWLYVCIFSPI